MRFVLLYRECLNEYGWVKRHEMMKQIGISQDEDPVVGKLRSTDADELDRKDAAKAAKAKKQKLKEKKEKEKLEKLEK